MDDEIKRRKSITFDEAEGLTGLPIQFERGHVSPAVRAKLWDIVFQIIQNERSKNFLSSYLDTTLLAVAKAYWVDFLANMADEFNLNKYQYLIKEWKKYYSPAAPYNETLGFTQWLLRTYRDQDFADAVASALEKGHMAYRLVDGDTIIPVASKEEADVVSGALTQLGKDGKTGAREHLRMAGACLSEGKFADSVRESIHSVESLVRSETGENSLHSAIKRMNEQTPMHEAFKKALGNLYGYSSDQQGIRHPLLDQGDANVTERDALFMLGVCAAFVTYLATYKISNQT